MSLIMLAWPYRVKRETGLLSVMLEGQQHLVKIYFEHGLVVGLSMGNVKNDACLELLVKCKPLSTTFINNYKVTDSIIAAKEEAARLDEFFTLKPGTGSKTFEVRSAATVVNISSDNLVRLEKDYIDMLGPIGKMMIDSFYADSGYKRGQEMPVPLYSQLIERLREELPAEYQLSFGAKYAINAVSSKKSG